MLCYISKDKAEACGLDFYPMNRIIIFFFFFWTKLDFSLNSISFLVNKLYDL